MTRKQASEAALVAALLAVVLLLYLHIDHYVRHTQ